MKFETKVFLWKLKTYFSKGQGLTGFVKYFLGLYGLWTKELKLFLIIGAIYGVACFFIGWIFFKYKWADAEAEVGNIFNPFVKEMRKKIR